MKNEFYNILLKLELEDYKSGKIAMTLKDAERLYVTLGITTTLKNNKIEFGGTNE